MESKEKLLFIKKQFGTDVNYYDTDIALCFYEIEKDLDRLEKYDKVKEFLKTNPSHLSAILGFDNYETFKNYYSYYYTKDVTEEIFNLLKEVFG